MYTCCTENFLQHKYGLKAKIIPSCKLLRILSRNLTGQNVQTLCGYHRSSTWLVNRFTWLSSKALLVQERNYANLTLEKPCSRHNITKQCRRIMSTMWYGIFTEKRRLSALSKFSIDLLAFYDEFRSLNGYVTHYLFCDR